MSNARAYAVSGPGGPLRTALIMGRRVLKGDVRYRFVLDLSTL